MGRLVLGLNFDLRTENRKGGVILRSREDLYTTESREKQEEFIISLLTKNHLQFCGVWNESPDLGLGDRRQICGDSAPAAREGVKMKSRNAEVLFACC